MRRFVQAFSSGEGLPPDAESALVELPQRYNIAVRKPAGVLHARDGAIVLGAFVWGLIPRWSKAPETKYTTVTARLERAARSRIFRDAWEKRRCVIPMSGYYKWDRTAKPPVPHFVQASSGEVLLAAGLWETWEKDDAPPLHSFSVLTHPNAAIPAPLVPDGPLFLPHDRWREWIDGEPWFPERFLKKLAQPALGSYVVSRAVRDPNRDDYTLLEPVSAGAPLPPPRDDDFESDGFDDE